jgi:neurofibromin 1
MCHLLGETIKEKFPDKHLIGIGGFIFLRFFCPSILLPTSSGIIEGNKKKEKLLIILLEVPSEPVKRGLLLITKVLQNLSNDILFREGEEHMMPFNEWLVRKLPVVRDYLSTMVCCCLKLIKVKFALGKSSSRCCLQAHVCIARFEIECSWNNS